LSPTRFWTAQRQAARDFPLSLRFRSLGMIIDDGVVTRLLVERGPGLDVSSADSVLDKL
jgi:peroxiredoxin